MKGGIACSILAMRLLAATREAWRGEAVLTLAGDEETMGILGTGHLLETVPHARGDAMICGDAGSPRIPRFGEKGILWLDVAASGKAAHGAHVHLGDSAIERLMGALTALTALRALPVTLPPEVDAAIDRAAPVSEPLSGAGETRVLKSVTVNVGTIEGGAAPNLVADRAAARVDVRLPVGLTCQAVEEEIAALLAPLEGIAHTVLRRYQPSVTPPDHEIVARVTANASEALGMEAVPNMRVGASDARLYRMAGIPTVVCGRTPGNMGGVDEFVILDDLMAVARIHTLTAFDYLSADFA